MNDGKEGFLMMPKPTGLINLLQEIIYAEIVFFIVISISLISIYQLLKKKVQFTQTNGTDLIMGIITISMFVVIPYFAFNHALVMTILMTSGLAVFLGVLAALFSLKPGKDSEGLEEV